MPTLSVEVSYRPLRVGFLVTSVEHVLAAAQIATGLWGGQGDLLIPLDDVADDPLPAMRRGRLDFFWDLSGEAESLFENHRYVAPPTEFHGGLLNRDHGVAMGAASMALPYAHLLRQPDRPHNGLLGIWPDGHAFAAFLAVVVGQFGGGVGEQDLRAQFIVATDGAEVGVGDGIPAELLTAGVMPLELTGLALEKEPGPPIPKRPRVFIGDPANFRDLCSFWNLRALGAPRLCFLSTDAAFSTDAWVAETLREDIETAKTEEKEHAHVRAYCGPSVVAAMPGLPARPELLAIPGVPEGFTVSPISADGWVKVTVFPERAAEGATVLAVAEEEDQMFSVAVPLAPHPFSDVRPTVDPYERWVARLQLRGDFALTRRGRVGQLPYFPDLNRGYSSSLGYLPDAFVVEPEGIGAIVQKSDGSVTFKPLPFSEVLGLVASRAGMNVTRSAPGELVAETVRFLGGAPNFVGFLRHSGIRALLTSQRARDGILAPEAIQIIGKGDFPNYAREAPPAEVFDSLVERQILRAVLEVQCPSCRNRSDYEPPNLDWNLQCPRCGRGFPLSPHASKSRWRYRLTGFFADAGRSGLIPVLLTMRFFASFGFFNSSIVEGPHMFRWDGRECEADTVFLEQQFRDPVAMCVAECKGGDEISEDDVRNLGDVSEKIRTTGVECYPMFAVLREAFFDDEIERFKALSARCSDWQLIVPGNEVRPHPGPILLTERELTYEYPYTDLPHPPPHQYAHGLDQLAENSRALYLQ